TGSIDHSTFLKSYMTHGSALTMVDGYKRNHDSGFKPNSNSIKIYECLLRAGVNLNNIEDGRNSTLNILLGNTPQLRPMLQDILFKLIMPQVERLQEILAQDQENAEIMKAVENFYKEISAKSHPCSKYVTT